MFARRLTVSLKSGQEWVTACWEILQQLKTVSCMPHDPQDPKLLKIIQTAREHIAKAALLPSKVRGPLWVLATNCIM